MSAILADVITGAALIAFVIAWREARRARTARVPGRTASPAQRRALWRAQRGMCARCGHRLTRPVEAHHLTPHSRGGPTSLANMVLLHKVCHAAETRAQARRYHWRRR